MKKIKLKEYTDIGVVGGWKPKRFIESKQRCVLCRERVLEDNWPPNYGGSSGCCGPDGSESKSNGSVKFVCPHCKVSFIANYKETHSCGLDDGTHWGSPTIETREITYSEPKPLVKINGFWCTTSDMWDEDYKKRNGHYPQVSYI